MKFGPFIAITLVIGAAVGWLAPGANEPAAGPSAANAPDSADQLAALQQDEWSAGEVVLPRAEDGHFYADVSVDGNSALMLVDTGASTIALTGEDAEAMGITWDESDVRPVASGASGPVYGVRVTLELVQVGELEAKDVAATVVPEGLGISLLGQSFLSQIRKVEMEQDRMILGG